MTLNQLYYFKTIANLQHFRLAAEKLNISQPSLSYSMSTLEKELGTTLFEKNGRNISLTKYGKVYLKYVEKALSILEEGTEKVSKLTNSTTGNIDIAYVFPLSPKYIPKVVRNFLDIETNKNITFTFKQELTGEIIEGLKTDKYDVGFCSFVEDEPEIEFTQILNQELIVIANPNHPIAKLDSINLEKLKDYPIIAYFKDSGLGKLTSKIFKDLNISPQIIFEGENELSIAGLVEQNFGVAIVAKTSQLSSFNLKEIEIKDLKYSRYIYMAHKKNHYLSPAVIKFINYIKNLNYYNR